MTFRVTWEIEIDADSPREAAELALEIQRDPDSEALAFDVERLSTKKTTFVNLLNE